MGTDKHPDDTVPRETLEYLVTDPSRPAARQLAGISLCSGRDGEHWRLYLDGDLGHYVEFLKKDMLYNQRESESRLVVWLRSGAAVTEPATPTGTIEFLTGDILRSHEEVFRRAEALTPRALRFAGCTDSCGGTQCQPSPPDACPPLSNPPMQCPGTVAPAYTCP